MIPTIVRWESVSAGRAMARDEGESEEGMMEETGSNPQTDAAPRADAPSTGALMPSVLEGSDRSEFLARIKAIIDNATEAVRAMKEENSALAKRIAALEDQNDTLTSRIHLLTSGLSREELALRQSVEQLAQTLQAATETTPTVAAPAAPPADTDMPAAAGEAVTTATEETPAAPEMTGASEETEPVNAREVPEAEAEEQALPESHAEAADAETAAMETVEAAAPEAEPDTAPQPEAMPESDTAAAEPQAAPVITGGVYTLITYPFVRFSDLGQFQAALQRLRGVHDVQVRRFAQGTLEMTARYEGETDLATALRSLEAEIEEVSEETPYRLRVRLRSRAEE